MSREKQLLIILAGIALGFDVDESKLSRIGATHEVRHRHDVRVYESRARWLRRQPVPQMPMGRYLKALLFFGAVEAGWYHLPVPVHQFRRRRVIDQVDGHRHALAKPNEGPGYCPVVTRGTDSMTFGDVHLDGTDAERDVRWTCEGLRVH